MQEANLTLSHFGSHYPSVERTFDEMCLSNQTIRPHWEHLMDSLNKLGPTELERRRQEAIRLLRDNGVTYNVFGDPKGQDRPWQLDLIPLLIASHEWTEIERGLIQRAELMNLLLTDLYGTRETLRKGLLPVEVVASYPGFLRACHGLIHYQVPSRHRLPMYAVDLVRSPQGSFWAVADRTQAPAGAGYALENRMVVSRILPSLYRDSHVHRLALFFRTLRMTLASMSKREDHRIVLLTPGPYNETYFEHAYLAKYLGYTMVQGADLMVREGKVRLKTLEGLQPVEVILRRVNDNFCDPLELRPDSYLGVAGLVQAVRMGNVAIANPLGSSLLENPGLLAFLPALAKYFLHEDLHIPSPTTWWCGQRQAREHVLSNLDKLVIKRIAYHSGQAPTLQGQFLSSQQREKLRQEILAQPHLFVGSEEIPRSTTPVFNHGRLEPRQMILRSFLVHGEHSYVVMPGGLARVSASPDSSEISTQGGMSKDTWVLASEPEKQTTLIINPKQARVTFEGQRELPSRVAENLFWLGRYAERAEETIRLLRTVLLYLAQDDFSLLQNRTCLHTLLRTVTHLTETYPGFMGDEAPLETPENELLAILLDKDRLGSVASVLQFLLNAAGSVRERMSPDMWHVINHLHEELERTPRRGQAATLDEGLTKSDNLITIFAAFAGLSMENMTHEQGWDFLMIGRRIERAYYLTQLLRAMVATVAPNEDESVLLEQLLIITDSSLTYRRRYRSQVEIYAVLELILQNESNPRALGYQLASLQTHINDLPHKHLPYRSAEERFALEALTHLRLADIETLVPISQDRVRVDLDQLLVKISHLLPNLSNALTNSYFSHTEQPRQLVQWASEPE